MMVFRSVQRAEKWDLDSGPAIILYLSDELERPDLKIVGFEPTDKETEVHIGLPFMGMLVRTRRTIVHYDDQKWWTEMYFHKVDSASTCVVRSYDDVLSKSTKRKRD
jgi:hypothetical protein